MTLLIPKRTFRDIEAESRGFAAGGLGMIDGRAGQLDRTEVMIAAMVERAAFAPGQRVLDIGCGNGPLLSTLTDAAARVGTVLTEEEKALLEATPHLSGVRFYVASFKDLSAIPGQYDRIIVNSAIQFTNSAAAARRALTNITALLALAGKLWLGELLASDVTKHELSSKLSALDYIRRRYGLQFALAFSRHMSVTGAARTASSILALDCGPSSRIRFPLSRPASG